MKLILATRNQHKILEMTEILNDLNEIELIPLTLFRRLPEVVESGATLRDNALIKARHAAHLTGCLCLAEDTGLEIDALEGKPGVRSARFAGENSSYEENVEKVLDLMKDVSSEARGARFRSIVAIMGPGDEPEVIEGICRGTIISERRGQEGFGYDPIFVPESYDQTFAQMDAELKNKISHRARALEKAKEYLRGVALEERG
ncbi:RdgB/HAM1 family non-canonical purine NTP pyrophosphatase [Candidatus Zixiibacteriota bacterium]